jgi:DNA-binding MarR family transcriptional regulator
MDVNMNLKKQYLDIYESFYEIVEQDYLMSMRSSFEYPLTLKDIQLLFAIETSKKKSMNYSSYLAQRIGATHSTFSNHLKILERANIIKRYRDPNNYKHMLIELDVDGIKYYEQILSFYKGLLLYFKANLSSLQLLELIKTIIFISNTFSEDFPKIDKPSLTLVPSFENIYEAFNRIYFFIFKRELDFLNHYEHDLGMTDFKLLSLSYIFEEYGNNQPSALTEKTHMQFSTISSIVHQLHKNGYIRRIEGKEDKRKLDIVLEEHTIKIVEDFMRFRIRLHEEVQSSVKSKQFELIKKSYQLIKAYTIEYKNKARL